MTFYEIFQNINNIVKRTDVSEISEHIAVEIEIIGDGNGKLYIEISNGKIIAEPYDYRDNDISIKATGDEIMKTFGNERAYTLDLKGNDKKIYIFRQVLNKMPMYSQKTDANNDFFRKFEEHGIKVTPEQRESINRRINEILNYEPRIGIFGKTGSGKSSLCNALFGQDICPISDVEACTRNTQDVILNMGNKGVKLIDVPGAGESMDRDKEYGELYSKLLPEIDLVLWLIKADDRALTSDQTFYKNIVKPHIDEGKPFFFVLNQVDKLEPFREWNEEEHEPGPRQFQNIHRKIDDVANYFDISSTKVIAVSANEKYNLTKLVDEFIRALPKEKKITAFRAVNEDFQSNQSKIVAETSFLDVVGDVVTAVVDTAGEVITGIIEKAGEYILEHLNPFKIFTGGCYITSAVCNNNSKPDDCYELQMFRDFRDNWLSKQADGNMLIDKYYRIAPKIVELIDSENDPSEIYDFINDKYLTKCLKYIENHEYENCKTHYAEMVENLAKQYLIWY